MAGVGADQVELAATDEGVGRFAADDVIGAAYNGGERRTQVQRVALSGAKEAGGYGALNAVVRPGDQNGLGGPAGVGVAAGAEGLGGNLTWSHCVDCGGQHGKKQPRKSAAKTSSGGNDGSEVENCHWAAIVLKIQDSRRVSKCYRDRRLGAALDSGEQSERSAAGESVRS